MSAQSRISSIIVQKALRPKTVGSINYEGFTIEFLETIHSATYKVCCDNELLGMVEARGAYWGIVGTDRLFKTAEAAAIAAFNFWLSL